MEYKKFTTCDLINKTMTTEECYQKLIAGIDAFEKIAPEATHDIMMMHVESQYKIIEQYAQQIAVEFASFTWMLDDDEFADKTPYELFDEWYTNHQNQQQWIKQKNLNPNNGLNIGQ